MGIFCVPSLGGVAQPLHWSVAVQEDLVRCIRSARPFQAIDEIHAAFAHIQREYDKLDRSRTVLLVDLRQALGRNDPQFETAMAEHRRDQLTGFRRSAIIVRTQIGQLQVARHLHEDGLDTRVFTQEDEALAFLGGTGRDGVAAELG